MRKMAGDVEIPPSNGSGDNPPKMQNDGTTSMSNIKNDGQRYEENRLTERHILFHFFTLFSISFILGILLIHLSLWMNSYVHTILSSPHFHEDDVTAQGACEIDRPHNDADDAQLWYTSVYTQDPRIKRFFHYPFYYTGNYFNDMKNNASACTRQNISFNFVVK